MIYKGPQAKKTQIIDIFNQPFGNDKIQRLFSKVVKEQSKLAFG